MKTILFIALLASLFTIHAFAGPRIVNNGGAGVDKNGVYMTFYSAKIYIEPTPESTIPGMSLYDKTIDSLASEDARSQLLAAAFPLGNHRYFRADAKKLDRQTQEKLLAEYSRITGQPEQNLVLFALTDIKAKTTYLLPAFYQLKESEQAAIIFHEVYWLLRADATYLEVVSAEIAFENYVDSQATGKYCPEFFDKIALLTGDWSIPLSEGLKADLQSGVLNALATPDGKSLRLNWCFESEICETERSPQPSGFQITSSTFDKLLDLHNEYPQSNFFRALSSEVSNGIEVLLPIDMSDANLRFCMVQHSFEQCVDQLNPVVDSGQIRSGNGTSVSFRANIGFGR